MRQQMAQEEGPGVSGSALWAQGFSSPSDLDTGGSVNRSCVSEDADWLVHVSSTGWLTAREKPGGTDRPQRATHQQPVSQDSPWLRISDSW